MTANVSIFYQSSAFTSSKVYYSNARHQFRMKSALLPLRDSAKIDCSYARHYAHFLSYPFYIFTKNSKCDRKC